MKKISQLFVFAIAYLIATYAFALPFSPAEVENSRQIILVQSEGVLARLSLYQKNQEAWIKVQGPWPAVVGRTGAIPASQKREGDGHTPAGLYALGFSFGPALKSVAPWPYKTMTAEDKWIDDPASPDYNKLLRGKTDAQSYEKMKRADHRYDWGLVIEYNTDPIIPGKGSAIFLHIWENPDKGTAGCVALDRSHVISILKWLDPSSVPRILILEPK